MALHLLLLRYFALKINKEIFRKVGHLLIPDFLIDVVGNGIVHIRKQGAELAAIVQQTLA